MTQNSSPNSPDLRAAGDRTVRRELRFSEMSPRRQAFIRRCQRIGFGKIHIFAVCEGDPVFVSQTHVLLDVKLDVTETRRPEQDVDDFVLRVELGAVISEIRLHPQWQRRARRGSGRSPCPMLSRAPSDCSSRRPTSLAISTSIDSGFRDENQPALRTRSRRFGSGGGNCIAFLSTVAGTGGGQPQSPAQKARRLTQW